VIETKRHIFLRKRIITLSHVVHIKMDATVHAMSHCFSLLPSSLLLIHCSLHCSTFPCAMSGETDQASNAAGDTAVSNSKGTTGAESETDSTSSSSNVAVWTMAKKEVPKLFEYWKALSKTKEALTAYHGAG
jgi:hypothetical protein